MQLDIVGVAVEAMKAICIEGCDGTQCAHVFVQINQALAICIVRLHASPVVALQATMPPLVHHRHGVLHTGDSFVCLVLASMEQV